MPPDPQIIEGAGMPAVASLGSFLIGCKQLKVTARVGA